MGLVAIIRSILSQEINLLFNYDTPMNQKKISTLVLVPIMLSFFAMGFVDLVGIAANYVQKDFALNDTTTNLLPSMVFFWFLICSIPTGMLMNKIGRKKTVLLSLVLTVIALVLPLFNYSFPIMLLSFSFLGIGNAVMQVSLNPLLSDVVAQDKMASMLTFGQFIKAIASFSAPLIAGWAAMQFDNWRWLFPIFMVLAILAIFSLSITTIDEEQKTQKSSSFIDSLKLLSDQVILLCFIGIMCHVGIDVGTNVTAPKVLMEYLSMDLADAGFATSIYFLFRLIGCLSGTFILAKSSSKRFFAVSIALIFIGCLGLLFADTKLLIYASVGMIGYGNSNVFSILFSQALLHLPEKKNEVSGLMIMGLFGGTVFPLVMGFVSDAVHTQVGAVLVMLIGVIYLATLTHKIKRTN